MSISPPVRQFLDARALIGGGRFADAARLCRPLLTVPALAAEAHHLAAVAAWRQGAQARAGAHLKAALALEPGLWVAWLSRAEVMGDCPAALAAARRAVFLQPDSGAAWLALGLVRRRRGDARRARQALRVAGLLTPDDPNPLVQLGADTGLGEDARRRVSHYQTRLAPGAPTVWRNRLVTLGEDGPLAERRHVNQVLAILVPADPEIVHARGWLEHLEFRPHRALALYQRVLAVQPDHADARAHRALAFLALGRLTEGWREAEWRWQTSAMAPYRRSIPAPPWQGAPLAGRRLLIWGEQGLGDQISRGHMAAELRDQGAQCTLECDPRLVSLMTRSLPGVEVVPAPFSAADRGARRFDYQAPLFDLLAHLRPTLASFPRHGGWMRPDPERRQAFAERLASLGPGPRIGIAWRSRLRNRVRDPYYADLEALLPVLSLPGVVLVTLQYDDCDAEVTRLTRLAGIRLVRWSDCDLTGDLEAAAALTACCDVVVTPGTMVADLANAVGVPTFMFGPSYRTQDSLGTDHWPHQPLTRLFARDRDPSWHATMARLAAAVAGHLGLTDPAAGARGLIARATDLVGRGALDAAAALCQPLVAVPAVAADAWHLLAIVALRRREAGAHDCGRRAVVIRPERGDYWLTLARIAHFQGAARRAARAARRAVRLDPRRLLAWLTLRETLGDCDAWPRALVAARVATLIDPARGEAWAARALALVGVRSGAAALAVERALWLAPGHPAAWRAKAVALLQTGDAVAAERACRRVLDRHPDQPELQATLAQAMLRQNRPAEALAAAEGALTRSPALAAAAVVRILALHRLGRQKAAIAASRVLLDQRPWLLELRLMLVRALRHTGRLPEARTHLITALRQAPTLLGLWLDLAGLCRQEGDVAGMCRALRGAGLVAPMDPRPPAHLGGLLAGSARHAMSALARRLVTLAPDQASHWRNLGAGRQMVREIKGAHRATRTACVVDPGDADNWYARGLTAFADEDPVAAEAAYHVCLCLRPDHAEAPADRAVAMMAQGRIPAAWRTFAGRWRSPRFDSAWRPPAGVPQWQGESLAGRSILVWPEQGLGDQIAHGGMAGELRDRGARCTLECDPRLVGLFRRSLPGVTVIGQPRPIEPPGAYDYHAPLFDLMPWLRPSLADFPAKGGHLIPEPERVAALRARLGDKGPRIGISWRSRNQAAPRGVFYADILEMAPILALPGVTFVNLQYDDAEAEIARARAEAGVDILRLDDLDLMNDLEGAAALTACCDLVISAPTSVADMANAVGVPAFVFLPTLVHRDCLGTDRFPYQPLTRLFVRRGDGDWGATMRQIAAAVRWRLKV